MIGVGPILGRAYHSAFPIVILQVAILQVAIVQVAIAHVATPPFQRGQQE